MNMRDQLDTYGTGNLKCSSWCRQCPDNYLHWGDRPFLLLCVFDTSSSESSAMSWGSSSVVERLLSMHEVPGSIPWSSIVFCFLSPATTAVTCHAHHRSYFWIGIVPLRCTACMHGVKKLVGTDAQRQAAAALIDV